MRGKILLIDHPKGHRDDRASRILAERGYDIEWICPGRGEALPEPGPEHVAAVVYGGPESANDTDEAPYIAEEIAWVGNWVAAEKPYLGICLGAQILARSLGADVWRHPDGLHEIGYVEVHPTLRGEDFLERSMHVYHWHKEGFDLPDGAELLVEGPVFRNQAYRMGSKIFGIQFHPEVTPEVSQRWMTAAAHMLDEPGAQPAEAQLRDTPHYDPHLEAWLNGFFDRWLDGES